jgi:hypothetical protein
MSRSSKIPPIAPPAKPKAVSLAQALKAKQQKKQPNPNAGMNFSKDPYYSALQAPFSKDAVGAQVPDMYSYPTATYHAAGNIVLSSDSNGIASVILYPHPYLFLLDMGGAAVSSSNIGMTQYANSVTSYAACTLVNLSLEVQNFRTVGAGIEIRNNLPPTSATGRVIVSKVPVSGQQPGPGALGANVLLNSYIAYATVGIGGTTANTNLPSTIMEYPDTQEVTVQDLITNCLAVNFRPLSPQAFNFQQSADKVLVNATTTLVSGDVVTTATGAPTANDAVYSAIGWDAILIRCEGLPASTANCIEIKYIHHYEGTPTVALGGGTGITISSEQPKPPVAPIKHLMILDQVLASPSIRLLAKTVAQGAIAYGTGGSSLLMATMAAKLGVTM